MKTDPKTLRILGIIIGIILLLCIGGVVLLNYTTRNLCSNQVFQQIPSPDKAYNAVVFQRSCGQTAGFSTEVSILPAGTALSNSVSGNVMDIDGAMATALKVEWTGERALSITYSSSLTVFVNKTQYKDRSTVIDIQYEVITSPEGIP